MARKERTTPRKLVRWDQEIDVMCFLAIPRIMARRGIKFPWGEVAAYVGPHVTGNALLQHMAKLTRRRAEMGQLIPEEKEPVGNPANFPMTAAAGFGDRRNAQVTPQFSIENDDDDNEVGLITPTKNSNKRSIAKPAGTTPTLKRRTPKAKSRAIKLEGSSDDDVFGIQTPSTSRPRPAREAAKRRRAFPGDLDLDLSDFDVIAEGNVDSPSLQSPKKPKVNGGSWTPSSGSESFVPSSEKVVSLSFSRRHSEFAQLASQWEFDSSPSNSQGDSFGDDFHAARLSIGAPLLHLQEELGAQSNEFMTTDMFETGLSSHMDHSQVHEDARVDKLDINNLIQTFEPTEPLSQSYHHQPKQEALHMYKNSANQHGSDAVFDSYNNPHITMEDLGLGGVEDFDTNFMIH